MSILNKHNLKQFFQNNSLKLLFWTICVIHFLLVMPYAVAIGFYEVNPENKQLFYIMLGLFGAISLKNIFKIYKERK